MTVWDMLALWAFINSWAALIAVFVYNERSRVSGKPSDYQRKGKR